MLFQQVSRTDKYNWLHATDKFISYMANDFTNHPNIIVNFVLTIIALFPVGVVTVLIPLTTILHWIDVGFEKITEHISTILENDNTSNLNFSVALSIGFILVLLVLFEVVYYLPIHIRNVMRYHRQRKKGGDIIRHNHNSLSTTFRVYGHHTSGDENLLGIEPNKQINKHNFIEHEK